jgi:hypothetical protein
VPEKVSTTVAALRSVIGENQIMAHLVEKAIRLGGLHRVLKPHLLVIAALQHHSS